MSNRNPFAYAISQETRSKMRQGVSKAIQGSPDPDTYGSMLDDCVDAVLDQLNAWPKTAIDQASEQIVYAIIGRINQEPGLDRAWQNLSPQRKAELATLWIELTIGKLQP